jgi:hypothetical protein
MLAEQAAHDDDPNDVSRLIEKGFLALNLAVRSELPIYSRIIASSKGRYSCPLRIFIPKKYFAR